MARVDGQPRDRNVTLAKCGLALALVPCCPLTGLVGAFLGLIALKRIHAAGTNRGSRLAVIAVLGGAVSAFVWLAAFDWYGRDQDEKRRTQRGDAIYAVITAGQESRPADASMLWATGDGRPTGDEISELGRVALERYGAVDRVAIVSSTTTGFFDPVTEVACVVHCEHAAPLASARFLLNLQPASLGGTFAMTHLLIEDSDRGDLFLGDPAPGAEADAP